MNHEATPSSNRSLYDRLGSESGLRPLVDEVIDRIADNPFLEYYFHDIDKGQIKILAYEYFSLRTGGPDNYTGRDLHSAFYSLNIRPEEFAYAREDVEFILDERAVGPEEKNEFLAIVDGLRTEITRTKVA